MNKQEVSEMKCTMCTATFTNNSNRRRHLRNVHGVDPDKILKRDGTLKGNEPIKEPKKGTTRRIILLPDFHHPHHIIPGWRAILKYMEDFQPDEVSLIGDAMNMDAVDHWKREKGNKRAMEGRRIKGDYAWFDQDILQKIEATCPNASWTYFGGNHEDWINVVTNKDPQMEGMIEPEVVLRLAERGWEWIPWITKRGRRGMKKYGKLTVMHGQYTNMHHAKKTAEMFSTSVAYGHTHDVQMHTKVTVDNPRGYHTAQSIGCLCKMSPDFMKGRENRWVNAFGVLFIQEDGSFALYTPHIIKGKFISPEGIEYNGN